jgi:hypothetical protein
MNGLAAQKYKKNGKQGVEIYFFKLDLIAMHFPF